MGHLGASIPDLDELDNPATNLNLAPIPQGRSVAGRWTRNAQENVRVRELGKSMSHSAFDQFLPSASAEQSVSADVTYQDDYDRVQTNQTTVMRQTDSFSAEESD